MDITCATSNQISLPIMVLISMCKSSVVNDEFGGDSEECVRVSMGLIFIYAIGFYVTFFGYGYSVFEGIKLRVGDAATTTTMATTIATTNITKITKTLKSIFLNHMICSVYLGITISLLPALQTLLYETHLRFIGDALETLGEPLVCLNCFIMSGSLGYSYDCVRYEEREEREERDVEMIGVKTNNATAATTATTTTTTTTADKNDKNDKNDNTSIPSQPKLTSVVLHTLIRLILSPLIILLLLELSIKLNLIPESHRIIRLIIAVEAAAPSAQMIIVSLTEIGVTDAAGVIARMYVPHYFISVVSIAGWTTVAGWIIYG
jgi:hypothetical protein